MTTSDREQRLNEAVAAYLAARDAGEQPDRRAWFERYPDLADELTDFLQGDERLQWLVTSAVPVVPAVGVVFGRYRIRGLIGRGGMGLVYEAEDETSHQPVALKVLGACGIPDPRERRRFQREIQVLTRLRHSNIIPILDVGECAGTLFFASGAGATHGATFTALV
jgi:hypothetical protein